MPCVHLLKPMVTMFGRFLWCVHSVLRVWVSGGYRLCLSDLHSLEVYNFLCLVSLLAGSFGSWSSKAFDNPYVHVLVGKRVRKRLDTRSIVQLLQRFDAPVGNKYTMGRKSVLCF
ncbi:hypothetical protein ACHQM5_013746 [Ranunculus cassubicifolius]